MKIQLVLLFALSSAVFTVHPMLAPAPDAASDQNPAPGGIRTPPERPYVQPSSPLAGMPSFEEQVVSIVNQERLANGNLPPLKHVSLLDTSSETHSSNMATRDFFAHCDPDTGLNSGDRMTAVGYIFSASGENIAAGSSTAQSVMAGWMASPGHRTNILRTEFFEIGVGYVNDLSDTSNVRIDLNSDCASDSLNEGPFFHYWTQNFGARASVYPVVINREAYETTNATVNLYVYGSGFASEMRFRNENGAFSPLEPYNPDKVWTLSPGGGVKEVFAEIGDGSGNTLTSSDTIVFNAPGGPAASFHTLTPCRAIDTRNPNGALGGPALFANDDRTFTLAGACGIPATAVALSVNVAVTASTAPGNLRLHPGGSAVPLVSTINYGAGATRSNNAVLALNGAGQLAVFTGQSSGTVHFILDVNGYFE